MSKKKHITSKNYKLYLEDILDASIKIESYVTSLTFEHFSHYNMAIDAVTRNLMIIGEAAKYMPDKVKEEYQGIQWKSMAGMRDRLIHAYFGIDYNLVWAAVKTEIPKLKPKLKKMLSGMEKEENE